MSKRARRGTGEGGIEELPSGAWRAILCRTGPGGKRVRSSKSFPTKAQALEWHRAHAAAGPIQAGTFGEWLTAWLALHKSEVSVAAYKVDSHFAEKLRRLRDGDGPPLGSRRLRDLNPLALGTLLASLSARSQSERHCTGRTLRMALNAAVNAGVMPASPMRGVKVTPPPKPQAASLTAGQLRDLINAAQELGYGPMFRLWADAGLRPGELLGLQWGDLEGRTLAVSRSVEVGTGRLKEPKTKAGRRKIALALTTAAGVEPGRAAAGDPMFPSPAGGHWWNRNFSKRIFDPVAAKAKVDAVPYSMRHTMATMLLRAGVGLKVVSERLGHEDVTTTLRVYSHVLPGDQEKAADVMGAILGGIPAPLPTPSPRPGKATGRK